MGREMGERFKREATYVYLWLIHVDVWQKPAQCCEAIILQLKIYILNIYIYIKKKGGEFRVGNDLLRWGQVCDQANLNRSGH